MAKAKWYVAHTYSGYENKVMTDIQKTVDNRNMSDVIQEIRVPMEEVIEIKDNQKKVVERKIYPSYVMVKMIMTDESWYVVRNTRGVTGFVGTITDIQMDKKKIRAKVSMFGRDTDVDLEFNQIEALV